MNERYYFYLAIALGATLGAILRYETTQIFSKHVWSSLLAVGAVNLIGSFIIGMAFVVLQSHSSKHMPLFMLTGFLGSLTTFSTFSLETMKLLDSQQWKLTLFFVIGQVVLGVLLCFAGTFLGRYIVTFLR